MPVSKVHLHECSVLDNEPVADGLYRLVLKSPTLAKELSYGQFINVEVPGDTTQVLRVPLSFSLIDAPEEVVVVVYAVVGVGTRAISTLACGEKISVVAPCGNPWRTHEGQGRSIIVAGGAGITPIVGAAHMLSDAGIDFDAVVGAQTSGKLWGVDTMAILGAGKTLVTTDDGTAGRRGFATDALATLLANGDVDTVYACGPEPMLAAVAKLTHEAGVACQVSMERMMCCGFGACGTCNLALKAGGYASVCMNGPIFDAEEVAW